MNNIKYSEFKGHDSHPLVLFNDDDESIFCVEDSGRVSADWYQIRRIAANFKDARLNGDKDPNIVGAMCFAIWSLYNQGISP